MALIQRRSKKTEIFPTDLLGNHRAGSIDIACPALLFSGEIGFSLQLHPQAFHSSKNTTQTLFINFCDINGFDFDFLAGFDQLTRISFLTVQKIDHANWTSFPSTLSSLAELHISSSSTGLNDWTMFPQLSRGINILFLQSNDIQDDVINRILNWTLKYSANTLERLSLFNNDLETIPWQLSSFPSLQYINLKNQKIGFEVIPRSSFRFTSPNYILEIDNNNIAIIEDGAFQGNCEAYIGDSIILYCKFFLFGYVLLN